MFTVHVSGELCAHADLAVVAPKEAQARAEIERQLDARDSELTSLLRESAAEQIRREMGSDAFEVDLEGVRPATPGEIEAGLPDGEDDEDEEEE